MTRYRSSKLGYFEKKEIDRKVKQAKNDYTEDFLDRHGYLFCEHCNSNQPHDRSHIVSVGYGQRIGVPELGWYKWNLEILCRECHDKIESMSNVDRVEMFLQRLEKLKIDNPFNL